MIVKDRVIHVLEAPGGISQNGCSGPALCPAHDDHHPSLSMRQGDDGGVLLYCFAVCKNNVYYISAFSISRRNNMPAGTAPVPS